MYQQWGKWASGRSKHSRTVAKASELLPEGKQWRPDLDLMRGIKQENEVSVEYCMEFQSISLQIFVYTWLNNIFSTNTLFVGHESKYREDNKSSNKTGPTVQQTEPEAVPTGHTIDTCQIKDISVDMWKKLSSLLCKPYKISTCRIISKLF